MWPMGCWRLEVDIIGHVLNMSGWVLCVSFSIYYHDFTECELAIQPEYRVANILGGLTLEDVKAFTEYICRAILL